MGMMSYLQLKGKQVFGLGIAAAFLSTIFAYGTGGYRAVREESLFFTPATIATHLESYNEEEKAEIAKDLKLVREVCFAIQKVEKVLNPSPFYLSTAGAPEDCASFVLERFMQAHPEYCQAVYLDRGERAFKFMAHTYQATSSHNRATAREKWQEASTYIALTLLQEAFSRRADIAYGTNPTGDFMKRVQENGYETTLVLCACLDEQLQQIPPYFTYGDKLYIYWSDDHFVTERLGAVLQNGQMVIYDQGALDSFVNQYEQSRSTWNLPAWDELLEVYQARF